MKKKLFNAILAVLMVVFAVPINGLAASVTDFTDVPPGAWYYDYVKTACDEGLINGTSATTFSPEATMSRGQFVTILGRYAKADTGAATGKFTDVPSNQYYAPYVYWAAANGIVNGTSATTFSPDSNLTKEQMATLLYRYAESENLEISGTATISGFADAGSVSEYAKEGVEALRKAGILNGDGGYLYPQKAISRAEATTMFVRFAAAVHVAAPDTIECEKLNVGSDQILKPGETYQVPVTFTPANTTDKTLRFESYDTSVATVDSNGLVTAISAGHTRITVRASNGVSNYVLLTVKAEVVTITGFELAWGNEWEIATYTGEDGIDYFSYVWITQEETTTMIREIGNTSGRILLSPQIVYSDGSAKIVLPESYGGYGFTFTSSDPSLVSINSSGAIIVHRIMAVGESPRTVKITVYSSHFETSETVTITLYHQA